MVASILLFAGALLAEPDTADIWTELDEVVVTSRKPGLQKLRGSALDTELISASELRRAACCNLGESFTTNPSVDVDYSDAAIGARQIRLLGLSGAYVQTLTENVPSMRGAAMPFGLSHMPGTWMQSIQVSKGASSVKNGHESITGQINIEMLKPQTDQSLTANAYADHMGRLEANVAGNLHLSRKLSAGLLLHADNSFESHDRNHDTFADAPEVRQIAGMNRWAWIGDRYIFQAAVKYLDERRRSGQITGHSPHLTGPYTIGADTRRLEGFVKNAYIYDPSSGGNVALILSGARHRLDSHYGLTRLDILQREYYASLMVEQEFGPAYSLSAGLSLEGDLCDPDFDRPDQASAAPDIRLWTPGAYIQWTLRPLDGLMVMAGIRTDHDRDYGWQLTPRLHARYNLADALSVHASAGRGYRRANALAENSWLLASSRRLNVMSYLGFEEAWNFGGGASGTIYPANRLLTWSADYYYTRFGRHLLIDMDSSADAVTVMQAPEGSSYSHALQIELTFQPVDDLTLSAAYRFTDVRTMRMTADGPEYGVRKALTSPSKGLLSVGYAPMMGIWQADVTLAVTGGGRMPDPGVSGKWPERYKAFPTLNAQLTRNFRHWSVYIGGENLTGYRQPSPVIGATDPFGPGFDATMVYGPLHGAVVYAGFRYTITKY